MIAVVPPELVVGAVVLTVILALARWGWNARKREAATRAYLEQAAREQAGREAFDGELEQSTGKAGARVLARRKQRRLRDTERK